MSRKIIEKLLKIKKSDIYRLPPKRLATPDCPIPYEHNLENAVIPDEAKIEKAIKAVLGVSA